MDKCSIAIASSLSKIGGNGKIFISDLILFDNQITLEKLTDIAHFEILNEAEAHNLSKFDLQLIWLAEMLNPDDFKSELNQLILNFDFQKIDTLTGPSLSDYSKF